MTLNICAALSSSLSALFQCAPHRGFIRVRTPFLYPDGGVIDVFVQSDDGQFTVTDLGEALGWLGLQSVSSQRSPKQQRLVQDVCQTLGVELFRGQLMVRGQGAETLSDRVIRLGQAAVRVSDLWFTMRTRSVESITDEVADYLEERHVEFERAVKLPGRSGRDWTIDFRTRTPSTSALVSVLSSGSRPGAKRVAEHVVAAWHDLAPFRVMPQAPKFISLFDDGSDVWSEEDFRLVESISEVGRWSRPDEFVTLLGQAA